MNTSGRATDDHGTTDHSDPGQRASRNRVDYGTLERLLHALSWRLPQWLFKYDHSYLIHGRQLRLLVRHHPGYQVRPATHDDLELFIRAHIDSRTVGRRLERGDSCIVVVKDEQLVGYSWSAVGQLFLSLSDTPFDTGEDGFFLYDVYTQPQERLKGFIMNCFERQLENHHRSGRPNAYGSISVFNTNSLKSHYRMGFTTIGEVFCLKFLGVSASCCRRWSGPSTQWHLYFRRPSEKMKLV